MLNILYTKKNTRTCFVYKFVYQFRNSLTISILCGERERERDWASGIPYALAAGLLKIKESEAMPPFFCAALSLVSKLTVKCAHKKIARFSSRDSLVLRRERDSNPRTR